MKEEQVKITKEEVDWKVIAGSLDEENKKLMATVVPVVSLNFSIDGIKDNDKWCRDHITFFLFIYVLPDCILLLYYFL